MPESTYLYGQRIVDPKKFKKEFKRKEQEEPDYY